MIIKAKRMKSFKTRYAFLPTLMSNGDWVWLESFEMYWIDHRS